MRSGTFYCSVKNCTAEVSQAVPDRAGGNYSTRSGARIRNAGIPELQTSAGERSSNTTLRFGVQGSSLHGLRH